MERPKCENCKDKPGLLMCYNMLLCGTCYMQIYNNQGEIIKQLLKNSKEIK